MCFGGSKSTKVPPPQQPTTFDYSGQNQSTDQRQAALYAQQGYTNRANFGADLTSGSPAPAATPAEAKPAMTGGI